MYWGIVATPFLGDGSKFEHRFNEKPAQQTGGK
jgi:hypothetical protein